MTKTTTKKTFFSTVTVVEEDGIASQTECIDGILVLQRLVESQPGESIIDMAKDKIKKLLNQI